MLRLRLFRTLLTFISGLLSGGGRFSPERRTASRTDPKKAIILSPGPIPTTDIYLKNRLDKTYVQGVFHVNTLRQSPDSVSPDGNTLLIVVRHAPLRWLNWLANLHQKGSRIVLMVDDDLPSALTASALPFAYAVKTAWRFALTKRFLDHRCGEIWVSTPALARPYRDCPVTVRTPAYIAPVQSGQSSPVYFYHGTWAHKQEMQWLVPIVKKIQQIEKRAWFEIMGDNRVRRLFTGIPRVRTVHPMPWPDYLAYSAANRYQVGLAPCLKNTFNSGRSHTKIFDITRLGGAGIYSDGVPYGETVIHGETGLLCKEDRRSWVAAVLLLLRNHTLRDEIAENARKWCQERSIRGSIKTAG